MPASGQDLAIKLMLLPVHDQASQYPRRHGGGGTVSRPHPSLRSCWHWIVTGEGQLLFFEDVVTGRFPMI